MLGASDYPVANRAAGRRSEPPTEPEHLKDDVSRPPLVGSVGGLGGPSAALDHVEGSTGPSPDRAQRPQSVLVYGDSRPMVNLLLYALAEDAMPDFHWLDFRPDSEPPAEWDPAGLGWLNSRRAWVADPEEGLSPDNARANAAIFELIRSDEPPEVLARLTDLLRLPPRIRHVLEAISAAGEPSLLAVANVDRVSESIPEVALAPIVAAFAWLRCSLYVGYAGARAPRLADFSTVLRIDGTSPYRWRDARVHFERGTSAERPGGTDGVLCTDLPFLGRVFQRALR